MTRPPLNFLRGTLGLLILRSLSWGPLHGYAVSEWLSRVTDGAFLLEEGTLYPALHRLERKGFVRASWGLSENKRRARFYELTEKGRRQLQRESGAWRDYSDAMARTLSPDVPRPGGEG